MRLSFIIVIFFLIVGCSNSGSEEKNEKILATNQKDSIHKYNFDFPDSVISYPGENNKTVKTLYSFFLKGSEYSPMDEPFAQDLDMTEKKQIRIFENEDGWEVLKRIFNAKENYIFDGDDSTAAITWKCSDCKSEKTPYHLSNEELISFPDSAYNISYLTGDYSFKIDSLRYRLITFVTDVGSFSISFTGRFHTPQCGYALFASNQRGTLNLVQYNFQVGSFGAFGYSNEPEIRIAHNKMFLVYSCCNSGPGMPVTCHNKIILLENGREYLLENLEFLVLNNTDLGRWDSKIQFIKNEVSSIPNIKVITQGWYGGEELDGDENSYVFDGVLKEFLNEKAQTDKSKIPFSFIMERIYQLKNENFELTDSVFRTKDLKSKK